MNIDNCTDEQRFKREYIREVLTLVTDRKHIFEIETEETFLGFPDVMILIPSENGQIARFFEFKYSTKYGIMKFQPTQPAFYRQHPDMDITVVAFNKGTGRMHTFPAMEIFNEDSPYRINGKAEVNLNRGEKK